MQLTLKDASGTRRLEAIIEADVVMQGSAWHPGLTLPENSFTAECAAYAVNEGRCLADSWDESIDPDVPTMQFVVSHATSDELDRLRLTGSPPAPGSEIRTASGRLLTYADGGFLDGQKIRQSMMEIDEAFVLTNNSLG